MINDALEVVSKSLKQDKRVQAIFVKGSFGRGEHDEHSDLDLYCLVQEKELNEFLEDRIRHLESYGRLLFHDDIFIVAPQILAVYENSLHVDLFTVTEATFIEKDFFKVIYDPGNILEKFKTTQNLKLSSTDFQDAVDDIAWFLFQYKKSAARGNDLWSVNLLNHAMSNLSRVLLHRYNPGRAQLGLKTLESSLPAEVKIEFSSIQEIITPKKHRKAAELLSHFVKEESDWILNEVENPDKIKPLWKWVLNDQRD